MILRKVLYLYESSNSSQSGVKNEGEPKKFEGVHYLLKGVGEKQNLSSLPERSRKGKSWGERSWGVRRAAAPPA